MSIAYQLKKVLQRIDHAKGQLNSITHPVTLLAVSKTHKTIEICEAFAAGQRDFGESYLQEALEKILALNDYDICWHYIGPIQSNKTAKIAEHFDWVHSVDRIKIARRLSEQRPKDLPPLNICLQVNISEEKSKAGVKPTELLTLSLLLKPLTGVKLRGIMCIPKKTADVKQQRAAFHKAKQLYEELKRQVPTLDTLSMGMSMDLEAAITEGSTLVRVGTDIFGARNKTVD